MQPSASSLVSLPEPCDLGTIPAAFRQQVQRHGGKPAVIAGAASLDYAALEERSTRLARRLREQGVRRGSRVAVCFPRGIDLIVTVLAVLKAGATFVPLDPAEPAGRMAAILTDAGAGIVVVDPALRAQLPAGGRPAIAYASNAEPTADALDDSPLPAAEPGDAAVIFFTSGSTNRPKGAVITHAAILNLVFGQDYVPFGPELRLLMISSPAFDAFSFELWGALLHGATCVVYAAPRVDLSALERTIVEHRATTCFMPVRLFNRIVDLRPAVIAAMRQIVVGGEALSPAHVRRAQAQLPHLTLVNGYGPTECTTFSCTYRIPPGGTWPGGSVPIGRPLAGVTCMILDDDLRPVAPGEEGELFIGGAGVSEGYVNAPALSADRFITLALDGKSPRRFYRSGDRCCRLPGGDLAYFGRRDAQVKLRGFRIELEAIEDVLRQHADVREVAVAVEAGPAGSAQLVGYLVPHPSHPLADAAALRAWLEARVPHYMCPAQFRELEELPVNVNGKLDRAALPTRPARTLSAEGPSAAPETPFGQTVAAIWALVLDRPACGGDDNFFTCGGDSLLALQLVVEIERTLGRRLPVDAVAAAPTVAQMVRLLNDPTCPFDQPRLRGWGHGAPFFYIPCNHRFTILPAAIVSALEGLCPYCDGLHFPGLGRGEQPLETLEEMAASLVARIRPLCPGGRCQLAGYSFGGELACEVARQLRAAEIEVERIFLLDSMTAQAEYIRGPMAQFAARLLAPSLGVVTRPRQTLLVAPEVWRRRIVGRVQRTWRRRSGIEAPLAERLAAQSWDASMRARQTYAWRPLEARGILLQAKQRPLSAASAYREVPRGGWDGIFLRGLAVHRFDCDHEQLIQEPSVGAVAQAIAQEIRAASAAGTPARSATPWLAATSHDGEAQPQIREQDAELPTSAAGFTSR